MASQSRNRVEPVTVAQLIAERADIYCFCDICGSGRGVRLERILGLKGPDFIILDPMPLCETPGCLGLRRFRDRRFNTQGFFMTDRGERFFDAHRAWLERTTMLVRRRALVVLKADGSRFNPKLND